MLQRNVQCVLQYLHYLCFFACISVKWFLRAEFLRNILILSAAGKAYTKAYVIWSARASALAAVGLCAQLPEMWIKEEDDCPGISPKIRFNRLHQKWVCLALARMKREALVLPKHACIVFNRSIFNLSSFQLKELVGCNLYTVDSVQFIYRWCRVDTYLHIH